MYTNLILSIGFLSSVSFTGGIPNGTPKNLPVITCIESKLNGSVARSFAIYQTNFATGNPATDRFAGFYYNPAERKPVQQFDCQRINQSALLWTCGESSANPGSSHIEIGKKSDGSVLFQYFEHDPIEDFSGPNDILLCQS